MKIGKYKPLQWKSHLWFAWWPVYCGDSGARYVWLEPVMRVRNRSPGAKWLYTLPNSAQEVTKLIGKGGR
jgi:hypothetical protein